MKLLALVLLFGCMTTAAFAQANPAQPCYRWGASDACLPQMVVVTPGASGVIGSAGTSAPRTAGSFVACSVTTSSAQCLAAALVSTHLLVQNNGTATVACSFNGAATLAGGTSFQLTGGQSASWGGTGWLPATAMTCIGAAANPSIYVEYN